MNLRLSLILKLSCLKLHMGLRERLHLSLCQSLRLLRPEAAPEPVPAATQEKIQRRTPMSTRQISLQESRVVDTSTSTTLSCRTVLVNPTCDQKCICRDSNKFRAEQYSQTKTLESQTRGDLNFQLETFTRKQFEITESIEQVSGNHPLPPTPGSHTRTLIHLKSIAWISQTLRWANSKLVKLCWAWTGQCHRGLLRWRVDTSSQRNYGFACGRNGFYSVPNAEVDPLHV